MDKNINWIESDGGPHIIIEKKLLKLWKGESDREFEQSQQYYEDACLLEDYIDKLQIGSGECVIISEDVMRSTWLSDDENPNGILVVLNYMEENADEESLIKEICKIDDLEYTDTGLLFHVSDNELYLFPACDFDSAWNYGYCKFNLTPGEYAISMIEKYILRNSSFRLFKFKLRT